MTPLPVGVARPLIDGVKNQVIVEDPEALQMFGFTPLGYEEAVRVALKRIAASNRKYQRSIAPRKGRRGCNLLRFFFFWH